MATVSQGADSLRGFLSQVEFAQRKGCGDALAQEFQDIKAKSSAFKQNNNYSTETGGRQENQKKNRYKDILPYDQTRVPVKLLAEEAGSDYINASFIQGPDKKPRYIATQGPLSHTVLDFWRMIWQYNVKVIVMACREVEHGKKKCERYWPLDDGHVQFGPFTISTIEKILVNVEVVLRRFRVMFQEDTREISHFQYVAWPDRGIPDSCACFLEMIQLVRQHHAEDSAPMCVHCSAGCGRTGVICTVEYIQNLLHKQRVPSDFSIYETVLEMRRQRPSAVQTKEQYDFLYHAVTEMFEKQLQVNHNYENLSKNKTSFYDDAASFPPAARTLTRKVGPSLSSEYVSFGGPDQSARSNPSMSETYAVVRKNKPAASGPPSAPRTLPSETQYDNIPQHTVPSAPTDPVYSTVAPKPNRAPVPPPSAPVSSSYSFAGMPSPPEAAAAEYAEVTMPRTVDTHSYASAPQSDSKWWPPPQSGFPPPPGKSAGMITQDDYEDVNNPSKGQPPAVSGGLGFNCRIAKPKGPREPPAEWCR